MAPHPVDACVVKPDPASYKIVSSVSVASQHYTALKVIDSAPPGSWTQPR